MSSKYAPDSGARNAPPMKLARRKELLRIELPFVDIGIPRIQRHDRGHAPAQIRRNDLRNNERFLTTKLVGIAELESENAEDVAGDVPGRLRVPAVGNFHDNAEAVGILRMLDGQAKQTVRTFFGHHAAMAGFEDG